MKNNEETENELAIEVGGYEHVLVLRNMKVVDVDAIEITQNLKRGTSHGDCILYFGKHFVHKRYVYFCETTSCIHLYNMKEFICIPNLLIFLNCLPKLSFFCCLVYDRYTKRVGECEQCKCRRKWYIRYQFLRGIYDTSLFAVSYLIIW